MKEYRRKGVGVPGEFCTSANDERSWFGGQSAWRVGAALSFVSLVPVAIFLRLPPALAATSNLPAARNLGMGEALGNRNIWLLMAGFVSFGALWSSVFSFYATFLNKVHGVPLERAAATTSLGMPGLLIGGPVGGFLVAKIAHLKRCLMVGPIVVALLMLFPFNITGVLIPIWWIAIGLATGFILTVCFTAAPPIMKKPELAGLGIAVLIMGNNAASFVGPLCFGAVVDKAGWNAGGCAMIPLILVGGVATRLTKFAE